MSQPSKPTMQRGRWQETNATIWVLIAVFIGLTAGAPLCFYFLPGFWAYLGFALLMLLAWGLSVVVLIPSSAARRVKKEQ